MSNKYNGTASINGIIFPIDKAQIPISDRGFLFGHSIFETILVKMNKIVSWSNHYERMKFSCENALIKLPDENILKMWCMQTIEKNMKLSEKKTDKTQLRIIVTGGNSFDLPIKRENNSLPNSNIIIICRNVAGPSSEQYTKGISLKCIPDLRSQGLIDIKSCSYLYNLMSIEMAKKEGFDDALFYNSYDKITESTSANFLWFNKDRVVYSTPFKGSCLAGTTLSRLIEGIKKRNLQFDWKELDRTHIAEASGCGIISSIRGIVPVKKIDENHFDIELHTDFFEELNKVLQEQMN